MNNRKILTTTELSDSCMNDVLALLDLCQQEYDTEEVCFLESEMNYDPDLPCYYLAYEDDKLICFLSVFIPDEMSCEIYSLTLTGYAASGVFKLLINTAIETMEAADIYDIIFVCDHEDKINLKYMTDHLLEADSSTLLMELSIDNPVVFNDATDIPPSDYIFDHEVSVNEEDEDSVNHTLKFSKNGIYYGYAQCEQYPTAFCIHHVEIEEALRGKGHGKELLSDLLTYCLSLVSDIPEEDTPIRFVLNVDYDNTAAYKLYKSFGFTCTQQIDYYYV